MKKEVISISGMTCASCAKAVNTEELLPPLTSENQRINFTMKSDRSSSHIRICHETEMSSVHHNEDISIDRYEGFGKSPFLNDYAKIREQGMGCCDTRTVGARC